MTDKNQDVGKRPLNIILDGATHTGKTALLECFHTGRFLCSPDIPSVNTDFSLDHKNVIVAGVPYKTIIHDLSVNSGVLGNLFFFKGNIDILIEIFAIDEPSTLEETIYARIPNIRTRNPNIPILLVGAKSDMRSLNRTNGLELFPSVFGPLLAECVGAVNYIECSAKDNFNVQKVFEEAAYAALSKHDLDKQWDSTIINMENLDNPYVPLIKRVTAAFYPTFESQLKEYFEMIENIQKVSQLCLVSSNEICVCLELEHERIKLSYRLLKPYITTQHSDSSCTLWYLPDYTRKNQVFKICKSISVEADLLCEMDTSLPASDPVNLRFVKQTCESIIEFCIKTGPLLIRSLVIINCTGTLTFSFLAKLIGLEYLVVIDTEVNISSLTFPSHFSDTMKHLVLNNCEITEEIKVPSAIGKLKHLRLLNVANNNFKALPNTLSSLHHLHTLLIDRDNIVYPPAAVMKRSAQEIINYQQAIQEDPVENKEAKLIIVGQEGVGKSTLIKAMNRDHWPPWFTENEPPPKTDGVDISVLSLKGIRCKVYDLAGDVEYLNTHSLFLSSNCLHLAVFDLSQFVVSKGTRSADHLCRLELWLQTIASQDPKSYVIIVGTHADHALVSKEMLTENRKLVVNLFRRYCSSHQTSFQNKPCEDCMVCNPDKIPGDLQCFVLLNECQPSTSCIPHIVGYFEVSGIKKYPRRSTTLRNTNLEELKSAIAYFVTNLMKLADDVTIPRKWLSIRETIGKKLSDDSDLKQQPLMPLSVIHYLALAEGNIVKEERVVAMLRFFHSQGTFLWYEDLPEMKDVVIINPQWLSDQLRTLISHKLDVDSLCHGVLKISNLLNVWKDISEENRFKLLHLFRSAGLCFSISDTEELFPCDLPIGWPDENMWSSLPRDFEKQTSLLFVFSFVPQSFFPHLIVEVNKKRGSFARNVQPLYYRFHIVYITKGQGVGGTYDNECNKTVTNDNNCREVQQPTVKHRVHYELMPYNNSLKVVIRGPNPSIIVADIKSTIDFVKSHRYPGITYSEYLLCPECEMRNVQTPAMFDHDTCHDGVCSEGHEVGSTEDILDGKLCPIGIRLPDPVKKNLHEVLEDHLCPKLFVVLPINLECLSLMDRFVYSHLRDGFAVHLLCECPDQWHFVDSPGFRIGKPKEFFEKYGSRVCKVLRAISTLGIPLKAAAAIEPHCKIGTAVSGGATSLSTYLKSLLQSYLKDYPYLSDAHEGDLEDLKSSSGLRRSDLSRFLQIKAEDRNFGPLVCTFVNKYDETLWLCKERSERFDIVKRKAK